MRLALDLARDERSNDETLIEQLDSSPRLRFGMLAGANLSLMGGGRPARTMRQAVANLGRRRCLSLLWLGGLFPFFRTWPPLPEQAPQRPVAAFPRPPRFPPGTLAV